MKHTFLILAGLLAATAAVAQPAPPNQIVPPPPGVGPTARGGPDADVPPPPPGGPGGPPRAGRPTVPPPPHGASFHLAHGADGSVRLDIECAERDATKDCADIASQMLGKLDAVTRTK